MLNRLDDANVYDNSQYEVSLFLFLFIFVLLSRCDIFSIRFMMTGEGCVCIFKVSRVLADATYVAFSCIFEEVCQRGFTCCIMQGKLILFCRQRLVYI
jgi:hypothetical protein